MQLIPSLDLLGGRVVRLLHGEFASARAYGDAEEIVHRLAIAPASRLHVVDLEASRTGRPIETSIVERLARRDLRVQVGGGIAGRIYRLTNHVATAEGREDSRSIMLRVEKR